MATESSRVNIVEAALVCGLAGAIGQLLNSAGQPLTESWITVVGPSKIIAAALLTGISVWLHRALRHGTRAIVAVALFSVVVGTVTPVEYWSVMLFLWGLWSAFMRSAVAPTLIALGAVGLHIALVG